MNILLFLSAFLIPLVIFVIVGYGLSARQNIYDIFVKGAAEGVRVVCSILPTLVGLMAAVGILRASGFLDMLGELLGGALSEAGFPAQLVPLCIVRMFSSSAATGLALDIFKEYGPDSSLGFTASLIMSCTETIFYTMSVYFLAAGVKKTRYTLSGALISAFAGIAASVILAR